MFHLHVTIFSLSLLMPLKFSEENDKTLRTIGKKTQGPFASAVVVL